MSGFEKDQQQELSQAAAGSLPKLETARRSGPLWYVREAIGIARFDINAIGRTSQDRGALLYGALFLAAGALAAHLLAPQRSSPTPNELPVLTAVVVVVGTVLLSAINIGVIHGVAKFLFGANGRYIALLRVLWLGSVVQWLSVVPVVGWLVGSVWFLLITLVAFEEIDGVERLQALMLVVAFGALMLFLRAVLT